MDPRQIFPEAGFVLTAPITGKHNGELYINFCSHRLMGMPQSHSGTPATPEMIAKMGLQSMHIPMDVGSWRRYNTGLGKKAWAVDAIINPKLMAFCLDDDFNKSMPNFRPHLMNVAVNFILKYCGVQIQTNKLAAHRESHYVAGAGPKNNRPVAFSEINVELREEEEAKSKPKPAAKAPPPTKLVEEVVSDDKPKKKPKPLIKGGFLRNTGGKLYPKGSANGDVPENAGDPLGYLPKKLRETCRIVDTNDPKYKQPPPPKQTPEQQMFSEMISDIKADEEKYNSKWADDELEDDGDRKYSVDYSRFDKIQEDEEKPDVEERDFYYNEQGEVVKIKKPSKPATATEGLESNTAKKSVDKPSNLESQMKGFLNNAKPGALSAGMPNETVYQPSLKAPLHDCIVKDNQVEVSIQVPGLTSMENSELDVAAKSLRLQVGNYALKTELPRAVNPDAARAKFKKKLGKIIISVPLAQD